MKFIICLDQNNGFSFHGKRQTKDKYIIDDMVKYTNSNIYCNDYSSKLFNDYNIKKQNSDDVFIFLEGNDVLQLYHNQIDEIIIYQWNCSYPSDSLLTLDFSYFYVVDKKIINGYSHEKVTRFILKKKL